MSFEKLKKLNWAFITVYTALLGVWVAFIWVVLTW